MKLFAKLHCHTHRACLCYDLEICHGVCRSIKNIVLLFNFDGTATVYTCALQAKIQHASLSFSIVRYFLHTALEY